MGTRAGQGEEVDEASRGGEERAVRTDLQNIEKAFVYIERDMSILGATAVEDELQDCIREDIQLLREAGITVAMATGREAKELRGRR